MTIIAQIFSIKPLLHITEEGECELFSDLFLPAAIVIAVFIWCFSFHFIFITFI